MKSLEGRVRVSLRHETWDADAALEELYAAHWRALVRLAVLLGGEGPGPTTDTRTVVVRGIGATQASWTP